MKQIENHSLKHELFRKLRDINIQTQESHLNQTVLKVKEKNNRLSCVTAQSNLPVIHGH